MYSYSEQEDFDQAEHRYHYPGHWLVASVLRNHLHWLRCVLHRKMEAYYESHHCGQVKERLKSYGDDWRRAEASMVRQYPYFIVMVPPNSGRLEVQCVLYVEVVVVESMW